ncbi:MAG: hypothetical protein IPJ17_08335 [Holophagales bacterium]|nr:MAG: hypothetical protein IPJ17_08335 [Holophagales bacterium]
MNAAPAAPPAPRTLSAATAASFAFALILNLTISAPAAAQVSILNGWTNISSTAPGNASGTVNAGSLSVSAGTDRIFLAAVCLEVSNSNVTVTTMNVTLGGTALATVGSTSATSAREHCWVGRMTSSQFPTFPATLSVQYAVSGNTVTGLHVHWGSYSGVDQATPINSSNAVATAATSVTFGATINYVVNGLTFYAAANGGSPATMTLPAVTPAFSQLVGTTSNGHSSFVAATAMHPAAGSYASGSSVGFGGTTGTRSALVVASLRPAAAATATSVGTVTATSSGCSSISVSAPYTGDSDNDNTLSYRYRTPSGSGAWTAATNLAHSASPYAFVIAGLTFGATYDVEVTYVDVDGVSGTNPQTVTNVTAGTSCTGAGTASAAATAGTTPSIALSAPYTLDLDGDNTLSYRYRTPSGAGAWVGPISLAHAASPYAATIGNLICGETYDVEITYNDPDGLGSGTQVQTVTGIALTACTLPGTVTASGGPCGSLSVSAPYTQDLDASNTLSYRYRTPTGTGTWSSAVALPHAASPYAISVTGLAPGSYDLEVTFADAFGVSGTNPQTVTNLAVTADCTTTGAPTASATSCTAISVSAPFTGDANTNGSTKVELNTSDSWPGTTACASLSGASPRTCAVSGLANASSYWFRVTFTDADGVNGTNPRVIGPVATLDCRVTPQAASADPDSCSLVTVTAPFAGDADGDSRTNVDRGTAAGGPFATAVCSNLAGVSPRLCADSTVAATSTYYYRVTFTDPDGIVGGASQVVGPVTTPVCVETRTTPGTASATANGCHQVTVTAPFSGDGDGDGSVLVETNTTNTWSGSQTVACPAAAGPSPRLCLATGLAASTAYYVRVTYNDPDGLLGGTSPQVLGPVSTTACTGNGAAPMILPLAPSTGAVVGGVERFRVQVYDPDGVTVANVLWGLDGGTLANTGVLQNTSYACDLEGQTACKVFEFDVITSALANGEHYVTVQATDSAPAPSAVGRRSWGFVVNNSGTAAAGNGLLLRRTHGSQLCLDCHAMATHSSQATSFNYGSWSEECLTCHTPHQTANLYLVRETIQTPASGPKALDFRNLTGKADYSFATVTAPGNGACEACHTKTKNSDGTPRFRNTGGSDGGKHYSTNCVSCHDHGRGFAAGESDGNANCAGCHADIWNGMQTGSAKATKHRIALDTFSDDSLVWPDETTGTLGGVSPALRSCVNSCHNDHPHTLTSPATATHENNVYMDATNATSRAAGSRTSATKDKTDFESAPTAGGMCLSCHRNPVDSSHPAINKAAYDSSAHDYVTFGAYGAWTYTQHDGGVFNRNCTKCHAGRNDARPGDNSIFFEAVHFSDYPSLLAGSTNPNGAPSTFVCYNCHGNGTTGVDLSGKNIATQIAKARNHPANADAVHNTVAEASAALGNMLGVAGRHSNCIDCHDMHEAKAGTAASPGNLAGPPLEGTWGAQLTTNPAFFTDTTAASFTRKTLVAGTDLEATLCFKCHSRYYWGTTATTGRGVPPAAPSGGTYATGTAAFTNGSATVTGTGTAWNANTHVGWVIRNNTNGTWYLVTAVASGTSLTISPAADFTAAASAYTLQMAETDVAKEFNPANVGNFAGTWASGETAGGFHPILATAGSNLGAVNLANLVTTNIAWSTSARNLMSCTDCHESETTTDPNGPHGSTAGFLLRGPNTTWNGTMVATSTGMPTGAFCANCHSSSFASSRFTGTQHYSRGEHRVACWNCHAAIPHGGPRPGMLVAPAGAAAGVGGTIAGWDTAAPYWGRGALTATGKLYIASYPANNTTAWNQGNCGCNGTGH